MNLVKNVERTEEGKVVSIVFEFGNIIIAFNKPGPKGEYLRVSKSKVYDRGAMDIPAQIYNQMIKMTYGIFNSKPSKVKRTCVQGELPLGL